MLIWAGSACIKQVKYCQAQLRPSSPGTAILLSSSAAQGIAVRQHFPPLVNLGLKTMYDGRNQHHSTSTKEVSRGLPRGSVLSQEGCRHNGK